MAPARPTLYPLLQTCAGEVWPDRGKSGCLGVLNTAGQVVSFENRSNCEGSRWLNAVGLGQI